MADPAVTLALTEVTFGNVLHAARIPFRGHCLAANQALILAWASRHNPSSLEPVRISCLAGIAKTFSIGAVKIIPALAITTQGLLFAAGTRVCGHNFFGRVVGSFLLMLWPSLQRGAVLGGLAYLFGTPSIVEFLIYSGVLLIGATLPAAVAIVFIAHRYDLDPWMRMLRYWQPGNGPSGTKGTPLNVWRRALRDLRSLPVAIALSCLLLCCWWDSVSLETTALRSLGLLFGIYTVMVAQHLFLGSIKLERLVERLPAQWQASLRDLQLALKRP